MPILYDVPKIGTAATNFGQKGPTCWYYAAKMLLKFHEMYDKTSPVYEQFKVLHELRKEITKLGDIPNDQRKLHAKRELRRKADSIGTNFAGTLAKISFGGDAEFTNAVQEFLDFLTDLTSKTLTVESRQKEALEKLMVLETRTLNRFRVLSEFVPDAGFVKIGSDTIQDREALEAALRSHGPLYAGGALSVATKSATGVSAGTEDILGVNEFAVDSKHAVVVAGISKFQTVYFKDPNRTAELLSVNFNTFNSKLRNWIGVTCTRSLDANGMCIHSRTKTLAIP